MAEHTPAERLARVIYPEGPGWSHHLTRCQRAVDAGWVHRDDLVAEGWTPPPDPWEAIARSLSEAVWPLTRDVEWFAPDTPSWRLLAAVQRIPDDLATEVAEALRGES